MQIHVNKTQQSGRERARKNESERDGSQEGSQLGGGGRPHEFIAPNQCYLATYAARERAGKREIERKRYDKDSLAQCRAEAVPSSDDGSCN